MKSMKKLVLAGLVLLASVVVLVGCDTNAGDSSSGADVPIQQPSGEGGSGATQEPSGDGGNGTEKHEHSFADEWSTSDRHHWKAATCEHEARSEEAEHTFGEWEVKETPTEASQVIKVCTECGYTQEVVDFVYIPEGSFQMGSEAGYSNNKPKHEVKISKGFFMGKYEVTQKEYSFIMGSNPSSFSSDAEEGESQELRPVENVSWYDAVVYCNKRSIAEKLEPVYKKGDETDPDKWGDIPSTSNEEWNNITCDWDANGYRLPTEAEWEYAARAGNDTTDALIWSETDKDDELGNYAWYRSNSENKSHEVGTKKPNAYGLYDVSGNVWEWCWNWFTEKYDTEKEGGSDPKGASSGDYRVCRGGGWGNGSDGCAVSFRYVSSPDGRNYDLGFRVVCPSSK